MFLKDSNNFIVDKANSLVTARTLTIGNSGKSFNGSANVSWSLSEIGAAAASHTHNYVPTSTGGNIVVHADSDSSTTTEYLALKAGHNILQITSSGGGTTTTQGQDKLTFNGNAVYHVGKKPTPAEIGALPLSGSTMSGAVKFASSATSTDVSAPTQLAYGLLGSYSNLKLLANTDNSTGADNEYVHIASARGLSPTTSQGIVVYGTYATSFGGKIVTETSGNAPTTTKLQTARTINGTSFDGTGNITTANWGTARTITIGLTGKSVNGSGNISWSLAEIGAFGKQGEVTATTDWNSLMTPGVYKVQMTAWGDTSLGGPNSFMSGIYSYGMVFVYQSNVSNETRTVQTYYPHKTDNSHPILTRMYNGSAWNTWSKIGRGLTYSDVGAAAASHTHSYLPLSGGTLTGGIEFGNISTGTRGITGTIGDNDYWRIIGGATASNSGYLEIATADDGNEPIYVRQYSSGKFGTLARTATLLDASGNTTFPGKVTASSFAGALSGNATTATTLQTARTITIGSTGKTFNGSANVSWSLSEIGAAATSHTHNAIVSRGSVTAESGVTGRPAVSGLSMSQAYNNGYPTAYGNVISLRGAGDGQILVGWSGSDGGHAPVYVRSKRDNTSTANWSGWAQFYTSANPQTTITGNAGTATTLQTARTLTIGSTGKTFNGSANVSWSLSEIGAAPAGYGLGTTCQDKSSQDCNNILVTGFYMGSNMTNKPSGCTQGWIYLLVMKHNDSWVRQVAYDFATASQVYTRVKQNGSWTSWVATDTNTWRGVQNNLTSTATDQSLSAAQGKVLNDKITSLQNTLGSNTTTLEANINSIKGVL